MKSALQALVIILAASLFQVGAHAAAPDNLFAAVTSKDQTALTAMVERGADVNARNDAGQTPLMLAATQSGSEKLIELLVLQGADIRARDKNGMTALMHAAGKGDVQNAEQLLQLGADPDTKDNSGKTVIDYANSSGLSDSIVNRSLFASMLLGKNHNDRGTPPYPLYISYKPGTISATEFEQAVVRAFTRKGWSVTEASGTAARAFYARFKQGRLYKVEVKLEPARIAVRYLPGFGYLGDRGYLESIRAGLMHEFALY